LISPLQRDELYCEPMNIAYQMVERESDFLAVVKKLKDEKIIGVDLEADSFYHYQAKVCLIQLSSRKEIYLIDPLHLSGMGSLAPVFANPGICKVFHGADYDIRSLHRDFGIEVSALFDTQIASRFLGSSETGLAHLIQERFGVHLDKKFQKKDWSKRPLPSAMREYAARDVYYLIPLAKALQTQLKEADRLAWVREECEVLSRVRDRGNDLEKPLFLKVRGAAHLGSRSLSVLESILQYRDRMARKRDLPPFKILGNATILEMGEKTPLTRQDLSGISGLSERQIKHLGDPLLNRIRRVMALPREALLTYPKTTRVRTRQETAKKMKVLKKWRRETARDMGIDEALILNKAQMQALAHPPSDVKQPPAMVQVLKKWQHRAFAGDIQCLLDG